MSGRQNAVRTNNVMLESRLRLSFLAITEAEMLSILSHYSQQRGSFESFPIPADVLSGVGSTADFSLPGYGWIYAGPPSVEDLMCGGHDVTLELISVPPEGTALLGLNAIVRALLTPGRVLAANGANLSVGVTLTPGAILAAGGATLTVSVTLAAGSVAEAATDPIAALSPLLWYDFSDASTVTLSGSSITAIADKGSRGWNLTASSTAPTQATWTNNSLKCVDWGSAGHSNYLRNTSTTSTDIAEIYIVLDASFGSAFPTYNGLVSSTQDIGFSVGSLSVVGRINTSAFETQVSSWHNAAYINGASTNSVNSVLPALNSPCLLRVKRTDDGAVVTNAGFQIGNERSNFANGWGWGGLVAEVIAFSTVQSSTDRATVQNALASKWGLTLS